MTYPISADVTDGQPTSYLHYNGLRADALTFGAAPADAVNLGVALARYLYNFVLEPLATNRLRASYNPLQPATLMIGGYLCQAAAAVDIAPGTFSGAAATWYIFANHNTSSTTFTLTANTSQTENAGQRRVAEILWDGANLVYGSLFVYPPGRPSVYYARVTRTAAQTLTSGATVAISFDTEEVDTDLMYAGGTPTRVTIQHSGVYTVDATLAFVPNVTGNRWAYLYVNGVLLAANAIPNTGANAPQLNVSLTKYFTAGDYVELKATQTSGGNLDTTNPITMSVAALSA